jgi:Domain of unknown function (DUF4476)
MKTISTLFTSLLMSAVVFATDTKSASILTIKSTTQGTIRVIVDGKHFEPGNNTVMIENVDAGYHSITVYRKKEYGFFNSFNRRFEMVYNSSIAVSPATSVLIAIDRFGRADISEQRIAGNGYDRNRDDNDGDYREGGYDDRDKRHSRDDNDRGYPDGGYNGREKKHRHNDDGGWDDNKNYNGYARAMSDQEFEQVLCSMQKEWFENNKMKSASHIISTNFFTAEQVKEMMSLFSFEENKLEIAKQAYSKTLDKQNYHCVVDALSFSSSKEELARFIRGCE